MEAGPRVEVAPASPARGPWATLVDVALVVVVVAGLGVLAWTVADRGQRCALVGCATEPQDLALGLDEAGAPIVAASPCSLRDVESVRVLAAERGGTRPDSPTLWAVSRPDPYRDDPTVVTFPERRSRVAVFNLGYTPAGFVERVGLTATPAALADDIGGAVVAYRDDGERLVTGGVDGLAPGQVSVAGEPTSLEAFRAQAREAETCRRARSAFERSLPFGAFVAVLAAGGALVARRRATRSAEERRVWDSNPR